MATEHTTAGERATDPPPARQGAGTGTSKAPAPAARPGVRRSRTRAGVLLLVPFLALFTWVYVLPIGFALYQSLFRQERSGLGLQAPERVFAGLDNYGRVLTDDAVISGVGRVLLFGVVQVPVMLGLALLLALLLDSAVVRFAGFFKLAFFLPYAVPGVIAAILWAFLYLPSFSPLRGALDIDFLAPGTVLWSTANVVTWSWTGYNMIIIYTALQAVPRELYEAARMDGASPLRINLSIKIPLVRPAIVLTGLFSLIGSLQLFNEPSVIRTITTNVTSTYTPAMAAYQAAFGANDYHYAAAIAVLLALTTCVLSFLFFKLTERRAR
ncbi:sugar ABC transporter permease [Streptomyces sp. L-9-10]|uniref:carbohydrate ABC transporter permease n=1 Tax=unclassified Streptomyces TaxID=2593676 RepID=UPI001EFFCFA1|nr:sugar ABC transporter permease [Streptomyces sp. L-9-10]